MNSNFNRTDNLGKTSEFDRGTATSEIASGTTSPHRRRSDKYKQSPDETISVSTPVSSKASAFSHRSPSEDMSSDKTKEMRPVPRTAVQSSGSIGADGTGSVKKPTTVPRPASLNRSSAARNGYSLPEEGKDAAQPDAKNNVRNTPQSHQQFRRPGADYDINERAQRPNRVQSNPSGDYNPKKKHTGLTIAIVAVLVVAVAVVALLLTPNDSTSFLGSIKTKVVSLIGQKEAPAAQVIDFSVAPTNGTAPLNIAFTLTTNTATQSVRIVDESGNVICLQEYPTTSNSESRIWAMTYAVDKSYKQIVCAEINDGAKWIGTTYQANIDISEQLHESNLPVNNLMDPIPTEAPAPIEVIPLPSGTGADEEIPSYVDPAELSEESEDQATDEPQAEATLEPDVSDTGAATIVMQSTQVPTLPPLPTPDSSSEIIPLEEYSPAGEVGETDDNSEMQSEVSETSDDENFSADNLPPVIMPPEPTVVPQINPSASESTVKIKNQAVYVGTSKKAAEDYARTNPVNMPAADEYVNVPFGVITFRGNAFRQNSAYGTIDTANPSEMDVAWQVDVGSLKGKNETYYGIGFESQPAIVKWSKDVRATLNLNSEKTDKSKLKEVIVAGLDGKIYFLDLDDGTATREPIKVGFPMRGTPSLHTLGLPIMMVGQNARNLANKTGDIGLRFFDLSQGKQASMINGIDKRAYGTIGSFNSSALIDKNSDTMIAIGTNGMLYTAKLNSEVAADGKTSFSPEIVAMKSMATGGKEAQTGTDSSLAMYQGYAYYADKSGFLHCVDVNQMTDLWAVNLKDETTGAIALDFVDNKLCIFTGNTLKNRSKGSCQLRSIDAETGEVIWETEIGVQKDSKANNRKIGAVASPVIGQNSLSQYVYFTVTGLTKDASMTLTGSDTSCTAAIIALDKKDGSIVWATPLDSYAYSSPVAVYSEDGSGWIIQGSGKGTLIMAEGSTGSTVCDLSIDGTIEGSPAVYLNTLVIGTTGKGTSHIYGIELK